MPGVRKEALVQAVEFTQLTNVPVTADGMADGARGGKADLAAALSGQKKRTSSGRTRRRPSFLTFTSSARRDSRSERGKLWLLIR